MTRRLVICGVMTCALTLAACGGGDPASKRKAEPRPEVASLEKAWSVPSGRLWNPPPPSTGPWAWTTDSALVVPEQRALSSYALADGAKRWTVRLPRPVCAVASAPNPDGIVAVLLREGAADDLASCTTVAAVDTREGRLRWTRSVGERSAFGFTDVAIGPDTVAVSNPCHRAVTLRVRDGAERAVVGSAASRGCDRSFASDGVVVVAGDRDRDRLAGYDATSDEQRWSVPVRADVRDRGVRPEVRRVLSRSPLVVEASLNSHRFLWRIDPKARTVTPIGREAENSFPPVFTQELGGRIAVQYGKSRMLLAYDAPTGRETSRTVLAPGESAFGVRDGAVISASLTGASPEKGGLAVHATDLETGAQQVLGTTPLDGIAGFFGRGAGFDVALGGSTMVLRADDELIAYRVPPDGSSPTAAPPKLADGEIAPAKAVDLCTGVTAATKRALGFADPALPAPASCEWAESAPNDRMLLLDVASVGHGPGGGLDATARAKRNFAQLARADRVNRMPALTPVADLGDEAAIGTRTREDRQYARMVARVANVVVLAEVVRSRGASRAAELRTARRGARLVVEDLLAELERRR